MPHYNYDDALESLHYIQKQISAPPEFAIVAGSGLGAIADLVDNTHLIDTEDIPHWPNSTAPGHAGKLIFGSLSGRPVVVQQGRVHGYEGYSLKAVTFPVRVFAMSGVKVYIATNASGAVNTSYFPGEIIAIQDHINLMGDNPLSGPNDDRWNSRFPDMSRAYDREILALLESFGLRTGVYAAFAGPSFETPAEVRMAGILGADLVGMSTVPEVITANAMGLRVVGLSCVANLAAGLAPEKTLTAKEVLDKMQETSSELASLIVRLISGVQA